jgi:hypothetical protein
MRVFWGSVEVALIVLFFYFLPTVLEMKLTPLVGSPAVIFIGDLTGCAGIALFYRKTGISLYAALACVKFALLRARLLPAPELLWVSDVLPTLGLVALAILVARAKSDGFYEPQF